MADLSRRLLLATPLLMAAAPAPHPMTSASRPSRAGRSTSRPGVGSLCWW
ncbi:hypothetical protein ACFQU7_05495 [Pseudoroseomonas wenyumeiae]